VAWTSDLSIAFASPTTRRRRGVAPRPRANAVTRSGGPTSSATSPSTASSSRS